MTGFELENILTADYDMTDAEKSLVYQLGICWNEFIALPDRHPVDAPDFAHHIHALQNIIMARLAARVSPHIFALTHETP